MNKNDIRSLVEKLNHILEKEQDSLSQKSLDHLIDIKVKLLTENDDNQIIEIIKELVKWFTIFITSNST